MKKRIDYISMDNNLLCYIKESLKEYPHKDNACLEALECFQSLLDGKTTSLMLELAPHDHQPSYHNPYQNIIRHRDLEIYVKARKVLMCEKEIFLTPKEFDILLFLAQNKGEVFTKEQIYQAVWDNEYLLDESNIMAFIRKLRKKIEPNPDSPQYILTIWGIGYKFNDADN